MYLKSFPDGRDRDGDGHLETILNIRWPIESGRVAARHNRLKGEDMSASRLTRFLRSDQGFFVMMFLTAVLSVSCRPQLRVNDAPATPTPAMVTGTPLVMPSPVLGKPYFGTGVITLINRKEGWVEIKHEEIKGLMPAMTMEFLVKTRSLLNEVQVGDRVDFTVVETRKAEFITELKKTVQ
jgi:Cu/Ag efflux protein CusF